MAVSAREPPPIHAFSPLSQPNFLKAVSTSNVSPSDHRPQSGFPPLILPQRTPPTSRSQGQRTPRPGLISSSQLAVRGGLPASVCPWAPSYTLFWVYPHASLVGREQGQSWKAGAERGGVLGGLAGKPQVDGFWPCLSWGAVEGWCGGPAGVDHRWRFRICRCRAPSAPVGRGMGPDTQVSPRGRGSEDQRDLLVGAGVGLPWQPAEGTPGLGWGCTEFVTRGHPKVGWAGKGKCGRMLLLKERSHFPSGS